MAAAAPLYPVHTRSTHEEQRVLLDGVPWSTYVVLRDSIDSPGVRMTYLGGLLEIMTPSREHEVDKTQIARLLELFCLERDIPLFGYGSTTFRREEKERGLEPDECYCRDRDKDLPDVSLEIVKTHGSIDKLDVYCGLGVREVDLRGRCVASRHAAGRKLRRDREERSLSRARSGARGSLRHMERSARCSQGVSG